MNKCVHFSLFDDVSSVKDGSVLVVFPYLLNKLNMTIIILLLVQIVQIMVYCLEKSWNFCNNWLSILFGLRKAIHWQ